ncbi:MAG: hypothetical protein MR601_04155 [Erysipelotrichaceae bacterium]|nr:hypothetical protein [Erysipelotrichaceae bacterium]
MVKRTSKKYKVTDSNVVNDKNQLIGAFRVEPIRLRAYKNDDIKRVHEEFTFFLNKIDINEFQIEVVEEEVDVKKYIDQINDVIKTLDINNKQDTLRKTILEREKIVIMDNVLSKNIVKKVYYFIFSASNTKLFEEKRLNIIKQFKSAGISVEELSRKDLISLNYRYFNPIKSKYRKIPKYYDSVNFSINDFVDVDTFEFKTNKLFDYIYSDGVYQKILYFAGYPDGAFLGWLNRLCDFRDCDVSMCFKKCNISNLKKIYNERLTELRNELNKTHKDSDRAELQKEIAAQMEVINKISITDMSGHNVFCCIRTKAISLEKLKENVSTIKEGFEKKSIILREGFFEQNNLLEANAPLLNCKYYDTYAKQIVNDVIALGYPFIKDDLMDEMLPILIGKTQSNGPVFYSGSYVDDYRFNYNEFIAGASGSGKTTLLLLLIWYRYARGEKQFILDIEGNQLKRMAKYMGGNIVDTSSAENGCINPLQVRIDFQDKEDENEDTNLILHKKPLSSHILFLRQFFRMLFRNKDDADDKIKIIELFLYKMYEKYNITKNTTVKEILNMRNDEFPIFTDLYKEAEKIKNDINSKEHNLVPERLWTSIMLDLHSLAYGVEGDIFNGHTTIDLYSNNLILFDFSGLFGKDKEMFKMQYFNCQTLIWGYIISSGVKQMKRIYKDEGHIFIESNLEEIDDIEKSNSRRIRKYLGGITFATQEIATTLKNSTGYTIFSQSQYRMIFKVDQDAYEILSKMDEYRKEELEYFKNNPGRGECILDTGDGSKLRIKVELQYLLKLFDSFANKG